MIQEMIERLKGAIKTSESVSPKHGVIVSQIDAKRLLYRLMKESKAMTFDDFQAIETALRMKYAKPTAERLLALVKTEGKKNA